jgi:hypothetical protein
MNERTLNACRVAAEVASAEAEAEKRFLCLVPVQETSGLYELQDSRGRRVYPDAPGGNYLSHIRGWFAAHPQA